MTTIHCRIVLPPSASVQVGGTLTLRIVDAQRQDVAATTVASSQVLDARLSGDRPLDVVVDLDLRADDLDTLRTLSIEAHLDVDGSGDTSVGDYRTMQHIAVDPASTEADRPIEVPVRRVS